MAEAIELQADVAESYSLLLVRRETSPEIRSQMH
jgi:hypothetical protein